MTGRVCEHQRIGKPFPYNLEAKISAAIKNPNIKRKPITE
jgi:hypothetical protein